MQMNSKKSTTKGTVKDTRTQVEEIIIKFMRDWNQSPSMGFIAGQIRPIVTVERVRQILLQLEKEGFIDRIKNNKYYKGFKLK